MATVLSGAQVSPSGQPGPQGIPAIPIGSVFDYAGPTAPSGYLLCYGQAVDRTTYSALFLALGVTYGVGDGTTTFNLPDCRGRVTAGDDDMGGTSADRLTVTNSGFDGKVIGAAGGSETFVLLTGHLPAHQHAGVDHLHGIPQHQHVLHEIPNQNLDGGAWGLARVGCNVPCGVGYGGSVMISYGNATWSGNSNLGATGAADRALTTGVTGSNSPHRNVQPTIVFNKIIFTGVFS